MWIACVVLVIWVLLALAGGRAEARDRRLVRACLRAGGATVEEVRPRVLTRGRAMPLSVVHAHLGTLQVHGEVVAIAPPGADATTPYRGRARQTCSPDEAVAEAVARGVRYHLVDDPWLDALAARRGGCAFCKGDGPCALAGAPCEP